MFTCLNCNMIGISASAEEAVEYAAAHDFDGVDLEITPKLDVARVGEKMQRSGVVPGSAKGLVPNKTDATDAEWEAAMTALPDQARRAAELGFTRTTSVVLPFHETLTFEENRALHVNRIRQVAPVLGEYGIRLGLEYVSQKTRRAGYPHEFVYDMAGLLEVIDHAGETNVGLLLDAFHWYCAREDTQAIGKLSARQVVVVHVNDAVRGRPIDEQVAFERELPGVTGEIDLGGFLNSLTEIGYDGPLTAEPMNAPLNAMAPEETLAATRASLERMLAAAKV